MNTAIMIGLDYILCPEPSCAAAWHTLHQCFSEAGFSVEDRLFTINLPYAEGTRLAEQVLSQATEQLDQQGFDLSSIVRTCCVFDFCALTELTAPCNRGHAPGASGIEVSFLETGAYLTWAGLVAH